MDTIYTSLLLTALACGLSIWRIRDAFSEADLSGALCWVGALLLCIGFMGLLFAVYAALSLKGTP